MTKNILFAEENKLNYKKETIEEALIEQFNNISINEKTLLRLVNVIITNTENIQIGTTIFNEVVMPDVIISRNLINDPELRFKIAHYIRNQLLENAEDRYFFPEYDNFIKKNSKLICRVIYYLFHKNYYGVYRMFPIECDLFFYDERLGDDLNVLIELLKKENAFHIYGLYTKEHVE